MNARWGIAIFIGVPLAILVGAVSLAPRVGSALPPAPDERIVAVVPSPDGTRGATVVEIVSVAPKVDASTVRVGGRTAFTAYGADRLSVRWRDAQTLEVDFDHATGTTEGDVPNLRIVPKGKVGP